MPPQTFGRDFPLGHPKACDYVAGSAEAIEWARQNIHPLGERDWPVGHPKAVDTPGNTNHIPWVAGVDPYNPHLEPHTGRQPEQAKAAAEAALAAGQGAFESPIVEPISADVANAALAAKRKELGVDFLNADQHAAVLAELQRAQAA